MFADFGEKTEKSSKGGKKEKNSEAETLKSGQQTQTRAGDIRLESGYLSPT